MQNDGLEQWAKTKSGINSYSRKFCDRLRAWGGMETQRRQSSLQGGLGKVQYGEVIPELSSPDQKN